MKAWVIAAALMSSPALAFHCRVVEDSVTSCFIARDNEPTKKELRDKNFSIAIEDYVGNFAIRIIDTKTRKELLSASRESEGMDQLSLVSRHPKVSVKCSKEPLKDCEKSSAKE